MERCLDLGPQGIGRQPHVHAEVGGANGPALDFAPDGSRVAFAGGAIEVKASKQVSLEMDSSPIGRGAEGGSPEGANPVNMVSMFQTNCTALRAEIFCNWAAHSGAVAAMDVSSWSGTSP